MCYLCGLSRRMLQMPFPVVHLVCHGHLFVRPVAIRRWPGYLFGRGVYSTAEQVWRTLSDSRALCLSTSIGVMPHLSCMLCMTTSFCPGTSAPVYSSSWQLSVCVRVFCLYMLWMVCVSWGLRCNCDPRAIHSLERPNGTSNIYGVGQNREPLANLFVFFSPRLQLCTVWLSLS